MPGDSSPAAPRIRTYIRTYGQVLQAHTTSKEDADLPDTCRQQPNLFFLFNDVHANIADVLLDPAISGYDVRMYGSERLQYVHRCIPMG